MKLPFGIDIIQKRIRIKTSSNSSSKQNKILQTKNYQTIVKNSLQKLKISHNNPRATNLSESNQPKLNLSRRPSINCKKPTQAANHNLLIVKKHDQSSTKTLSNQPILSKRSQKSRGIIHLLINRKQNNSVYEQVQSKSGLSNDNNNNNQIINNQIFKNDIKPSEPAKIDIQCFEKRTLPRISLNSNFFAIYSQFSFCIDKCQNLIKKEASTQTFFQGIQDEFFFEEYVKYKTHKEKYLNILTKKRQKIQLMFEQHATFEKDYETLINSIKQPPSEIRETRILNLAKDLEQAEKNATSKFNRMYQTWDQITQIKKKQAKTYFDKKEQLSTSIQNLTRALIIRFQCQKLQNSSEELTKRILQRIISQFKYLGTLDNQNRNRLSQIYKMHEKQVSQFETYFNQWKDILYQNRVLLFNFMKQIQKVPLIMTEIFGFGQISEDDLLALDKCVKPSANFMQCCEDCYSFKKNVKHLQVWNSQLKPVFKTVEWLIRDGDKKRQIMELI